MTNSSFFNEQTEHSLVKAAIVSKYFDVWAKVIISTQKRYPENSSGKIAYIDLFPLFSNDDDTLKEEYTLDGLHPNGKGYLVWKSAIERYVFDELTF